MVLHPDGAAERWTTTASGSSGKTLGHWSSEGRTLTLVWDGEAHSIPYTFYKGQLVLPNIPNNRDFWDRVE